MLVLGFARGLKKESTLSQPRLLKKRVGKEAGVRVGWMPEKRVGTQSTAPP